MSDEHASIDVRTETWWEIVAMDGIVWSRAATRDTVIAEFRQSLIDLEQGWMELERLGKTPRRVRIEPEGVRRVVRTVTTAVAIEPLQPLPDTAPTGVLW